MGEGSGTPRQAWLNYHDESKAEGTRLVLLPCLRFYPGDIRSYGDGGGAAEGRVRGSAEV